MSGNLLRAMDATRRQFEALDDLDRYIAYLPQPSLMLTEIAASLRIPAVDIRDAVYQEALDQAKPWALKLAASSPPLPPPLPPSSSGDYFGFIPPDLVSSWPIGVSGAVAQLQQVDLKQWGTIALKSGVDVGGMHIYNHDWIAMGYPKSLIRLMDVLVDNVLFSKGKMWCARLYGVQYDVVFERVSFTDTQREHGCYSNMAGLGTNRPPSWPAPESLVALRFHRCLFENLGGQGIQTVLEERGDQDPWSADKMLRINETTDYDEDATPGGWLVTDGCMFRATAQDTSRPAFAISHFQSRNNVLIRASTVDNLNWADGSNRSKTYGAVMIQGCPAYTDVRGVYHEAYDRKVVIEDSDFHGREYAQPVMLLERGLSAIRLRRCTLNGSGGQNMIRVMGSPNTDLLVEDCEGNAVIEFNGKVVGTVANGFQS